MDTAIPTQTQLENNVAPPLAPIPAPPPPPPSFPLHQAPQQEAQFYQQTTTTTIPAVPFYQQQYPMQQQQQPVPFQQNYTGAVPAGGGVHYPAARKVLVVLSSQSSLHLREGKIQQTGTFLSELARPLGILMKAGFQPVFATPLGESSQSLPPPIDPMSDSFVWFSGKRQEYDDAKKMLEDLAAPFAEGSFSKPRKLSTLSEMELQSFYGIFIPGGHAPYIDLYKDLDLGRILRHFHKAGKPTGVICHGPAALLSAGIVNLEEKQSGRPTFSIRVDWPYAGYHMTCYSDREEKLNELVWRDKVPFLLESVLRRSGAVVEVRSIPYVPNVVQYKELISAQGPTSATQFGNQFRDALIRYSSSAIQQMQAIPMQPQHIDVTSSSSSPTPTQKQLQKTGPESQFHSDVMATQVVTPYTR